MDQTESRVLVCCGQPENKAKIEGNASSADANRMPHSNFPEFISIELSKVSVS